MVYTTDYWVVDASGIVTCSFLYVYIRIICGDWELTRTCKHVETLIGERVLHIS